MSEKKEKNDLIEKNKTRAERLIRLYMKELSRPEKLDAAPINQIASALGTLVEKFGKCAAEEKDGTIIVTHSVPRSDDEVKGE